MENGRDALAKLRAEKFDVVFMDVRMPVMDGLACVQAIRRGEAGHDNIGLRVVALTANALKGDREKYLDAGMDDYIAKPIDFEELDGRAAPGGRQRGPLAFRNLWPAGLFRGRASACPLSVAGGLVAPGHGQVKPGTVGRFPGICPGWR